MRPGILSLLLVRALSNSMQGFCYNGRLSTRPQEEILKEDKDHHPFLGSP